MHRQNWVKLAHAYMDGARLSSSSPPRGLLESLGTRLGNNVQLSCNDEYVGLVWPQSSSKRTLRIRTASCHGHLSSRRAVMVFMPYRTRSARRAWRYSPDYLKEGPGREAGHAQTNCIVLDYVKSIKYKGR